VKKKTLDLQAVTGTKRGKPRFQNFTFSLTRAFCEGILTIVSRSSLCTLNVTGSII